MKFRIITSKRLETLEMAVVSLKSELEKLCKVRRLAMALDQKGISVDDLLSCKVHLRRNPRRKAA